MKSTKMFAVLVAGLLLVVAKAGAEEKANAEETMALTPVRVTVVFTEYEGEKKISSLPYVLSLNSSPEGHPSATSLRMGLRVPFLTKGSVGGQQEVQYQDVGTNIDCAVEKKGDGRFTVHLKVERLSVYSPGPEKAPLEWKPGQQPLADKPIFSNFSTEERLLIRDNHTVQAMLGTDPVSGRVWKTDVTLNVVKDN